MLCTAEQGKGFFPNRFSCIYIFSESREEGKYAHSFIRMISKYFIIDVIATYNQDFYI